MMALNNILLCHHLAIIADLKKDDTYRTEAFEVINEAIRVFQKVGIKLCACSMPL